MIQSDPIVDEVRKAREEHAAKFNYDLEAIYRDLKEQEKRSGRTFLAPKSKDAAVFIPQSESPPPQATPA